MKKTTIVMAFILFCLAGASAPADVIDPNDPNVINAAINIDPDTLNLKSKGKWITCRIELPEGYDVHDIDVSTIMLNGVVPAQPRPVEITDTNGDGVAELMVKFSRSAVQALLTPDEETELIVSGELADGTIFEGTDTIRVIDPGKKNGKGPKNK